MVRKPQSYQARLAGDEGAVVIEAALVLPVLLVFLSGIIDFGVGFRNRTLLQSALRNGARSAAAAVNDPTADQLALSTLVAGLQGATNLTLDKAIIFEANTITDGRPTGTCLVITPTAAGAGNSGANCNVYGPSQIAAAAAGSFDYGTGSCAGWARYWCPGGANPGNERTANLPNNVDALGFYVEASYAPFTGLFSDDVLITDSVVMSLEPAPG